MKSHCHIILSLFLPVFLVVGCASYKISMDNSEKIASIKTWHIRLTSEYDVFEKALSSDQQEIDKSKESVLLKCDLQLRDRLSYYLKNKYQMTLVSDMAAASGFMRMDAECRWGYYDTLDVTIYDLEETRLAEIEVKNGGDILVKDSDAFAEYCADAIAEVILGW